MPAITDYPIDESLVVGLDIGIGSIGSAMVRHGPDHAILFAGSRCFAVPEEPKTREPKNKTRRDKRGQRRVIRRRRQRLAEIRRLLHQHELLASTNPSEFQLENGRMPDPWLARAEGLDRLLAPNELAATLLHIAKHRGFKSNRKNDVGQSAPDDNKKMLAALSANKELSAQYRTVGEMVAMDEKFVARKRNRSGEYTHTLSRDDLHSEVEALFAAQRRFRNADATEELERAYGDIAFHQRPLQDSEWMVAFCPFEPEEKRTAKYAPSFEKFRFLAKLNTVKVIESDGSLRRLKSEELKTALEDFGSQKSISWNGLAGKLGFGAKRRFEGIDDKKAKKDVCTSSGCSRGTATLKEALGTAGWNALCRDAEALDHIAYVFSFRDDLASIESGLAELGIDPLIVKALMTAARDGKFGNFKGAGHISAKAARALVPHLLERKVYSEACTAVGYDHAQARKVTLEDIRNPVVQRCLREARKQFEILVREFGARPGRVIVELARNVGKSAEEREEITRGLDARNAEKNRHAKELKELLDMPLDPSDEDLRRFELWKEQNYRCIYSDASIRCQDILATSNLVQVDHVLPRSLSQDNSFHNQVLSFAKANQDKGQRTPWEWKVRDGNDTAWWDAFEARVRALNLKGMKRRNLLMRNFDERRGDFVARNLNDTKYAARASLSALREYYPDDPDPNDQRYLGKNRRLFARPGTVTALVRRAWGLERSKDRSDDRHHALDALICASASQEWLLERLTREYQEIERENRARWVPNLPRPWTGFHDDAMAAIESVFVSRSENRRGRGQGHKDTIYRVGIEDGNEVTFERRAINNFKKADIERIKDPERNAATVTALADWIDRGKPKEDPPRSPKGDPIRKVVLRRGPSSGFHLNGGHVDNADMVRIDVFQKDGKFYLVPIYVHQVMDKARWPAPPDRAIVANKPEHEWVVVDSAYDFRFSLYSDSYIEVVKGNGERVEGYYRSTDRSTGAITLSPHNRRETLIRGIGARTLSTFKKFEIDRLGRKHEIQRETRTWHGAACI